MSSAGDTPPPGPLMIDLAGHELDPEDRELLAHPAVGGVILFGRNFGDTDQLRALTDDMRACRSNLLIACDYEGGRVQRFCTGLTRIPAMRRLGDLWHDDRHAALTLATDAGWLMACELAALGVALPLAPVVDIDHGRSAVIGDRAFASEARVVAALAQAFMAGLKDGGSAATAKHFPGHGYATADSHAEMPEDGRAFSALAVDMAPYQSLMADGLASVMMAHIFYPEIDWLPASLSKRWIEGFLRGDLGFDGCVFCDDLSMGGAAETGDPEECAELALAAGCDYLPVCNNRAAVRGLVGSPVLSEDAGPVRRQRLHAACGVERAKSLAALKRTRRWQQVNRRLDTLSQESG